MLRRSWPYQQNLSISFAVFSVSGITAICFQQPWLVLIAFGWIFYPFLYDWFITKPAKLFWLLLAALPLSTELNITPQLGLDFPDEPLLMLLTGISLVKIVHEPDWFPVHLRRHPLFVVIILYMAWLVITCIYSTGPLLSVKFVLAKIWYILPFVVLPQVMFDSKQSFRKMGWLLLLPMLFVVVQALFRHAFYGFSFEGVKQVLSPFFRNHVNYSSMLVCLLPVGWCCWKMTPPHHSLRKWIMAGLLTGLAALFFAYSRGAWAALLIGAGSAVAIRKRWMGKIICLTVFTALVSITWLVANKNYMRFAPDHDRTVFHTDFREHMLATVAMKDVSTAERFYRWVAGFRMITDRPLTGFGPNSFYYQYKPYTVARFETWVSDNKEHSTVHNYFLLITLEQGIVGLVLFCILYFGAILYAQRLYHRLADPFHRAIALTTGVVLVMVGVINTMSDMIETDKIGSLFWLGLGMVIWGERKLVINN